MGTHCVTGLGNLEGYDAHSPAFHWASEARFAHLRSSGSSDNPNANNEATAARTSPKAALHAATTLAAAIAIATETLVAKFSSVLIVPPDELSREKSVVSLGLDSLVAVEVRSWIKREMDAGMSTMELLTSASIGALAEMVVGRSGFCAGLREEEGGSEGVGEGEGGEGGGGGSSRGGLDGVTEGGLNGAREGGNE